MVFDRVFISCLSGLLDGACRALEGLCGSTSHFVKHLSILPACNSCVLLVPRSQQSLSEAVFCVDRSLLLTWTLSAHPHLADDLTLVEVHSEGDHGFPRLADAIVAEARRQPVR